MNFNLLLSIFCSLFLFQSPYAQSSNNQARWSDSDFEQYVKRLSNRELETLSRDIYKSRREFMERLDSKLNELSNLNENYNLLNQRYTNLYNNFLDLRNDNNRISQLLSQQESINQSLKTQLESDKLLINSLKEIVRVSQQQVRPNNYSSSNYQNNYPNQNYNALPNNNYLSNSNPSTFDNENIPPTNNDGLNAVIQTNKGRMWIELFYKQQPELVAHFIALVEGNHPFIKDNSNMNKPFYNGQSIRRADAAFIDFGEPHNYVLPLKINQDQISEYGFVDSGFLAFGSSQDEKYIVTNVVFINKGRQDYLSGNYPIFGKVINGHSFDNSLNVLNSINQDDKIEYINIQRWDSDAMNFNAPEILRNSTNFNLTQQEIQQNTNNKNLLVNEDKNQSILERIKKSDKPIIVYACASWADPCSITDPIINKLKNEYGSKIDFLDLDPSSDVEFAKVYNMTSFPTIYLFHNGKLNSEYNGIRNAEREYQNLARQALRLR